MFHRVISDLSFSPFGRQLTRPQIYELADRMTAMFCSDTCMVVQAEAKDGFNNSAGRFGFHEPWPEWANMFDLVREGLVKPENAPHCDG